MNALHIWTQDGELWTCAEYDHGPFCRNCKPVDTIIIAAGSMQRVLGIIEQTVTGRNPEDAP